MKTVKIRLALILAAVLTLVTAFGLTAFAYTWKGQWSSGQYEITSAGSTITIMTKHNTESIPHYYYCELKAKDVEYSGQNYNDNDVYINTYGNLADGVTAEVTKYKPIEIVYYKAGDSKPLEAAPTAPGKYTASCIMNLELKYNSVQFYYASKIYTLSTGEFEITHNHEFEQISSKYDYACKCDCGATYRFNVDDPVEAAYDKQGHSLDVTLAQFRDASSTTWVNLKADDYKIEYSYTKKDDWAGDAPKDVGVYDARISFSRNNDVYLQQFVCTKAITITDDHKWTVNVDKTDESKASIVCELCGESHSISIDAADACYTGNEYDGKVTVTKCDTGDTSDTADIWPEDVKVSKVQIYVKKNGNYEKVEGPVTDYGTYYASVKINDDKRIYEKFKIDDHKWKVEHAKVGDAGEGAELDNKAIIYCERSNCKYHDKGKRDIEISSVDGTEIPYDGKIHNASVEVTGGALHDSISIVNYNKNGKTSNYLIYNEEGKAVSYRGVLNAGKYEARTAIYATDHDGNKSSIGMIKTPIEVKRAELKITTKDFEIYYGSPVRDEYIEYIYTGFAEGEDESVLTGSPGYKITRNTKIYEIGDPVGEYHVHVIADGLAADNYYFTPVNGAMNVVAKPVTVHWENAKHETIDSPYEGYIYTGGDQKVTAVVDGRVGNDNPEIVYEGDLTGKNVGNYTTTAKEIFNNDNYVLKEPSTIDWSIKPAPLTVTPKDFGIYYGSPVEDTYVKYKFEGFVGGETKKVLTGEPIYTISSSDGTPYEIGSSVGEYSINVSGYSSANYDITYGTGVMTVEAKPVTAHWETEEGGEITESSPCEYTYNGEEQHVYPVVDGLVGEDTNPPFDIEGTYAATDVNDSYTATATAIRDNTNYKLMNSPTVSWSIKPYEVNVKWHILSAEGEVEIGESPVAVNYNGNYYIAYYDAYGVGRESKVLVASQKNTESLDNFEEKNAGTYKAEVVLIDKYENNYTLATGSDSFNWTIIPAKLTVTPDSGQSKYVNAPLNITYTAEGLQGDDKLTEVLTGKPGLEPNDETVGSHNIVIGGLGLVEGNNNYSLDFKTGVTFEIKTAPSPGPGPSPTPVVDDVKTVIDMINALDPEKASYLKDAKAAIEAYDALTDSQKADSRFTTDVLNKLNAAKDAVEAEEEIKDVIKMISELDPESETYVEDAKEAVSAYNALSDAQKADSRFEDEGVAENLDAAEKVVKSEEEIEKVLAMIKILDPNSPAYGVEAMLAIEAFNALTPEQQNDGRFRVQEVASVIADAKAAAATEKDKEAAQPVIDQINALNEKSTKAEVEAARKAFDALKPSEQAACGSAIFKLQGEEYRIYSTEAKAKKVKKFKAKNLTGKKAKLTWNAVSDVDGYRITYKANGVKTKKIMAGASEIKKTIKKLKKGKKYTFTIQPYNNVYNPITAKTEKVYGKKSTKKVKIRK